MKNLIFILGLALGLVVFIILISTVAFVIRRKQIKKKLALSTNSNNEIEEFAIESNGDLSKPYEQVNSFEEALGIKKDKQTDKPIFSNGITVNGYQFGNNFEQDALMIIDSVANENDDRNFINYFVAIEAIEESKKVSNKLLHQLKKIKKSIQSYIDNDEVLGFELEVRRRQLERENDIFEGTNDVSILTQLGLKKESDNKNITPKNVPPRFAEKPKIKLNLIQPTQTISTPNQPSVGNLSAQQTQTIRPIIQNQQMRIPFNQINSFVNPQTNTMQGFNRPLRPIQPFSNPIPNFNNQTLTKELVYRNNQVSVNQDLNKTNNILNTLLEKQFQNQNEMLESLNQKISNLDISKKTSEVKKEMTNDQSLTDVNKKLASDIRRLETLMFDLLESKKQEQTKTKDSSKNKKESLDYVRLEDEPINDYDIDRIYQNKDNVEKLIRRIGYLESSLNEKISADFNNLDENDTTMLNRQEDHLSKNKKIHYLKKQLREQKNEFEKQIALLKKQFKNTQEIRGNDFIGETIYDKNNHQLNPVKSKMDIHFDNKDDDYDYFDKRKKIIHDIQKLENEKEHLYKVLYNKEDKNNEVSNNLDETDLAANFNLTTNALLHISPTNQKIINQKREIKVLKSKLKNQILTTSPLREKASAIENRNFQKDQYYQNKDWQPPVQVQQDYLQNDNVQSFYANQSLDPTLKPYLNSQNQDMTFQFENEMSSLKNKNDSHWKEIENQNKNLIDKLSSQLNMLKDTILMDIKDSNKKAVDSRFNNLQETNQNIIKQMKGELRLIQEQNAGVNKKLAEVQNQNQSLLKDKQNLLKEQKNPNPNLNQSEISEIKKMRDDLEKRETDFARYINEMKISINEQKTSTNSDEKMLRLKRSSERIQKIKQELINNQTNQVGPEFTPINQNFNNQETNILDSSIEKDYFQYDNIIVEVIPKLFKAIGGKTNIEQVKFNFQGFIITIIDPSKIRLSDLNKLPFIDLSIKEKEIEIISGSGTPTYLNEFKNKLLETKIIEL